MRVVVTGATGFIGGRVVRLLRSRGHATTAIARVSSRIRAETDAAWLVCDLADATFARALPASADAIVHLAQAGGAPPDAANLAAVNVESTRILLDYARRAGVDRFVLASSGSVYGGSPVPLREDDPLRPLDPYARSKARAEELLEGASDAVATCALRLFAPYGPGQRGRLIADLVDRIAGGRPVTLRDGGHPRLNPIYVDDVAAITVNALEVALPPRLNVAGDEVLSIRDVAETIGRVLGVTPRFEEDPGDPPGDLVADTTLLHRTLELGSLTSFEAGIAAIADARSDR